MKPHTGPAQAKFDLLNRPRTVHCQQRSQGPPSVTAKASYGSWKQPQVGGSVGESLYGEAAPRRLRAESTLSRDDGLLQKLKRAWKIMFPEEETTPTPKDSGKERLRLVLVADRCGLSPGMLSQMKRSIADAVSQYVEVTDSSDVDFNVNVLEDSTVFYSVGVPVRRVHPEKRFDVDREADAIEWNPDDPDDSDPSLRFPYGC